MKDGQLEEPTKAAAMPMAICNLVLQFNGVFKGSTKIQPLIHKRDPSLRGENNTTDAMYTGQVILQTSILRTFKHQKPEIV